MKPLVFYDFKEIEGTNMIGIDKEKFQKILTQVYDEGVEDGKIQASIKQNGTYVKPSEYFGGNPILTCTEKTVNENL